MQKSILISAIFLTGIIAGAWELLPKNSEILNRAWARNIDKRVIHEDGSMSADVTGVDPYFGIIPVGVPKDEAKFLAVDIAYEGKDSAHFQVFLNLGNKQNLPVTLATGGLSNDGKIHRYIVDLTKLKNYDQIDAIETLRFDPVEKGQAGDKFRLKGLYLVKDPKELPEFVREQDFSSIEYEFSKENIFVTGSGHNLGSRRIENGVLEFEITGKDPYFAVVPVNRPLTEINRIAVEMAVTGKGERMQLFVNLGAKGGGGYVAQAVKNDGEFHTYVFNLDKIAKLAEFGELVNFRLDPTDPGDAGDRVKIRAVRLFHENYRNATPLAAVVPPVNAGALQIDEFRRINLGGKAAAWTHGKLNYDRDYLYIELESELENVNYVATHKTRDSQVYKDDSLEFFLMPTPQDLYQIVINPDGAIYDSHCKIAGTKLLATDLGWDAQAEVKTEIIPGKWRLKLKLPFKAFGLNAPPQNNWKVSIVRNSVADGKGVSAWHYYKGLNRQIETFRVLQFGPKPSPSITCGSYGNLYLGNNEAVLQNPGRADIRGTVKIRNRASGKEETFTAAGNTAELRIPYRVGAPGEYDMWISGGNNQVNYFADFQSFTSIDLSGKLSEALEKLAATAAAGELATRKTELLAAGQKLEHQLKESGQLDVSAYRSFQEQKNVWQADAKREYFRSQTAENFKVATPPLALACADSMDKIFPTFSEDAPEFKGQPFATLSIEAAANESEGIQLVLIGLDKDVQNLSLKVEGDGLLTANTQLYHVEYLDTTGMQTNYPVSYRGKWPEMLIPGVPRELKSGEIRTLWLNVDVPKGTKGGEYRGSVVLTADNARFEIPLQLKVWNFALPQTSKLRNAMSVAHEQVLEFYEKREGAKLTEEQRLVILDNLAKFMLKKRMNPSNIYDWTAYSGKPISFPRPDKFREYADLGMNAVPIANLTPGPFQESGDWLRNWYNAENRKGKVRESIVENYRLARAAGIENMLYLHGFDEVGYHRDLPGKAKVINELATYWREAEPDIKIECITTVENDLIGAVKIWCPAFQVLEAKKGAFMARKQAGDELWVYTCLGSPARGTSPSFVLESSGMDMRLVGWLCRYLDADGFLYYALTHWRYNYPKNGQSWPQIPWNPVYVPGYNGEAVFIYPGATWDADPVGSIRLENLRDGFEDFDYLMLLKERSAKASAADRAEIENLISAKSLIQSTGEYSDNPAQLREIRRRIAALIEKYPN